jgi:hypothetical protein
MKQTIVLPSIPPLWYQLHSWKAVDNGILRKLTSYPRRHGKDFEDLSLAARDCVNRRGSYYYVFPTRRWGERAIWETMAEINGQSKPIIEWIFPEQFCKRFKSDLRIEVQGKYGVSKLFMGGTDNLDFVGQGGQGYTMSEFSLHREEATSLLAPIIRQSQAYLRLNGTMRGKENQLYKILMNIQNDAEWYSTWLRPIDTKLYCWVSDEHNINPELLPLIGKINPATGKLYTNCQGVPYYNIQSDINSGLCSYAFARQEYLNEADGGFVGAYFTYEISKMKKDGRVGNFGGIDHSRPIVTSWDIGGARQDNDTTSAVLWQEFGNRWRVVGYYDDVGNSIENDIKNVIHLGHGAFFGGHFVPHDAKRTSKQTQVSLIGFSKREFGFEMRGISHPDTVKKSIELCRRKMIDIEIDLDGENVPKFLDKLSSYREDQKTGRPDHSDNSSHAGDACRTGLEAMYRGVFKAYLDKRPKMYDENLVDDGSDYLLDNCGTLLI